MTSRIERAFEVQKRHGVVGFATTAQAVLVYLGSFTWFSLLIACNAVVLATDNLSHDEVLYGFLIGSNAFTFLVQTVDVLTYNQGWWPLVSLNWTSQLASIGLASAALGRALQESQISRVYMCVGLLYAQCLFTASQFAVTLSTLWRHASTRPAVRPSSSVVARRGSI